MSDPLLPLVPLGDSIAIHMCVTNFFSLIAVSQIAYLASDVIVSVQPSLSVPSDFSTYLEKHASTKEAGVVAKEPEVRRLPQFTCGSRLMLCR